MRITWVLLAAICVLGFQQPASADPWLHNYAQAQQTAKQKHMNLLVYWTGEGWCPYCTSLDKDVMNQAAFTSWASSHVVMCKINCPNGKGWGGASAKFKVHIVPTRIVLDPNGKVLARANGYGGKGTPAKVISWIQSHETTNETGSNAK